MATHSRILAWRIPWAEEPEGLQSMGSEKSWTQLSTHGFYNLGGYIFFFFTKKKGIGSKPIQHLYLTLMTSLRRYSNPESSYQSKLLSATLLPSHLKIKKFLRGRKGVN